MAKDDVLPAPNSELILALQNRINDLEAKYQAAETERKGKNFIDQVALDGVTSAYKTEIGELRLEIKALKKDDKVILKKGDKGYVDNGDNQESDFWGIGQAFKTLVDW